MRLLLVFLPLLAWVTNPSEVLDLPVDKKTEAAKLGTGQCRKNTIPSNTGTQTTEERCYIDMSKRFVVAKSRVTSMEIHGFCNKRLYKCRPHSLSNDEICQGTLTEASQNLLTLEAGEAAFSDSNLCQLLVKDNNQAEIEIYNRFKQPYFAAFKNDATATPVNRPLYVASVANYMDPVEDLPRSKTEEQDNMIFGDTFTWKDAGNVNSCGQGCDYGAHLSFKPDNNKLFDIMIYPKDECEWIAVCFDFNVICKERSRMMFMLKLDIVLPHTLNSAISMPLHNAQLIRLERRKEDEKMFYVTTDNNDRLALEAINTKYMAIMMSRHDCLAAPLFTNIGEGEAHYISTAVDDKDEFNRQNKETMVEEANKPAFKSKLDDSKLNNKKVATDNGNATAKIIEVTESTTQALENLTDSAGAKTTEVTIPQAVLGSALMASQAKTTPEDEKDNKTGWLTWAYLWGSLAGSTTGFLLCGVFFFLCRRSIYQNWYRGVYKRYGCDASGTTGGATGAEFGSTTGGGQTTIGAETAGASTMGTTGGSTSSAMSTMDDKTGTSMITM